MVNTLTKNGYVMQHNNPLGRHRNTVVLREFSAQLNLFIFTITLAPCHSTVMPILGILQCQSVIFVMEHTIKEQN